MVVNSDKFEDWSDYTQKSLGMQQVDRGKDILSFRMDDQKQRLTITGDTGDGLGFLGWEVDEKEDLLLFASKLEENKIEVYVDTLDVLSEAEELPLPVFGELCYPSNHQV